MRPLFNHSLITSFALWIDHKLLNDAQAYVNITTGLFPQQSSNGHCWASPYKSWVYDSCVSGATIASGVYNSSGQFLTRSSGIVIDYINGRIFSPHNWGNGISGSFAKREFNIYTASEGDVNLWIDNVYNQNKDISYTYTGIPGNVFAAPCIILTNCRENNDPFAIGGLESTQNTFRAYIIANNSYLQEGINSYFRDLAREYFSLVSYTDAPISSSGDLKTGYYCYSDLCARYGVAGVFVDRTYAIKIAQSTNNATTFRISAVEFDTNTLRLPRSSK